MVRMQRVQALICFRRPLTMMVMRWMFGRKTRFVWTFEWLTLFPACFFFPQISQIAMSALPPFTRWSAVQYHSPNATPNGGATRFDSLCFPGAVCRHTTMPLGAQRLQIVA